MNMTKKINVNFSSLVGLKAELLRKQTEVNEVKFKNESISGLPQMNKKRNKKKIISMEKNTEELIDSDNVIAHKKSKLMLEAKTRLYEKLKKSRNNNDNFLVDFRNKLDESDESNDEFVDKSVNEKHPIEPEENWVEYQDCFGRTRKCLWKDVPYMQKKNELLKQKIMRRNIDIDKEEESKEQFSIQEKESDIEIMRQKWEEQTQKLADKVDIHYQDVLFDEARTHGVGYYAFSQNEDERAKQQENLATLRKETERKQVEMKEIKELKERMELNRLKAARIRQRIRAGLPVESTEEELAQKSKINFTENSYAEKNDDELAKNEKYTEKSNEETAHNSLVDTNKVNANKIKNYEDEIKIFEKLLDKKNWHVMSQEEWIHKCRTQRISEFGPIYNNFMSAEFYSSSPNFEREEEGNKKSIYKDNGNNSPEKFTKDIAKLKNYENYNVASNEIAFNAKYIGSHSPNDKNSLAEYDTNKNGTEQELPRNLTNFITLNSATSLHNNPTHVIKPEAALLQHINEDNIMAGLKYLREKFEETHNK